MDRLLPILLAGWLAGCSALGTPSAPSGARPLALPETPPAELQRCQASPQRPAEPPAPRTVDALRAYAGALVEALDAAIAARDDCRRRLGDLNDWILERD